MARESYDDVSDYPCHTDLSARCLAGKIAGVPASCFPLIRDRIVALYRAAEDAIISALQSDCGLDQPAIE